jgi:hypothetical protein
MREPKERALFALWLAFAGAFVTFVHDYAYRRTGGDGVLPNGTWVYRRPGQRGVDYEPRVRVVARGDNGTSSSSG